MARRDNHLAARALADWARDGFREATIGTITDTYGVTSRTLWRWKKALDTDTELSGLFRARLDDLLDRDWAQELDTAIAESIERLRALIAGSTDLSEVVEAFRALAEVALTREVLRGDADADSSAAVEGAPGQGARRSPPLPN